MNKVARFIFDPPSSVLAAFCLFATGACLGEAALQHFLDEGLLAPWLIAAAVFVAVALTRPDIPLRTKSILSVPTVPLGTVTWVLCTILFSGDYDPPARIVAVLTALIVALAGAMTAILRRDSNRTPLNAVNAP